MTAPAPSPIKWTRLRWVAVVALVYVSHVGFVFRFGARPQTPDASAVSPVRLCLAADPWSEEQLHQRPTAIDPALFALPSQRGFSGRAWLKLPLFAHELATWTEAPRWLEPDPARLGQSLLRYIATSQAPSDGLFPRPLSTRPGLEVYVPPEAVRTQSVLRVEGPLAGRAPWTTPPLPSWPHPDILNNTVVQLLVDAQGHILSATALQESGSPEADRHALRVAGQMRFPPWPEEDPPKAVLTNQAVSWGSVVFQWHTLPRSATNPPSPRPTP